MHNQALLYLYMNCNSGFGVSTTWIARFLLHRLVNSKVSRPLMDKVNSHKSWSEQKHGHLQPPGRTVIALRKLICDLKCANYMLSNNQKLMIATLLDGHRGRAHKQQMFKNMRTAHGSWSNAWISAGTVPRGRSAIAELVVESTQWCRHKSPRKTPPAPSLSGP